MNKLLNPGRIMFAVGASALGLLCFILNDFIVGRPPAWPEGFSINPGLAYITGTILVIASLAILLNRKAGAAALLIAAMIFLFSLLRGLPGFMNHWLATYKTMALLGGSLIIAASFFSADDSVHSGFKISKTLIKWFVLIGCLFLAIFFIAAGYAHFKFADFTSNFIPSYIPFRSFWAYFCGVCLVAGGLGILIPKTRKLAALLSGIMVSGWFLLLHIPRFIADTNNVSDRLGLCESFTIAGIFFVLAGMHSEKNQ